MEVVFFVQTARKAHPTQQLLVSAHLHCCSNTCDTAYRYTMENGIIVAFKKVIVILFFLLYELDFYIELQNILERSAILLPNLSMPTLIVSKIWQCASIVTSLV